MINPVINNLPRILAVTLVTVALLVICMSSAQSTDAFTSWMASNIWKTFMMVVYVVLAGWSIVMTSSLLRGQFNVAPELLRPLDRRLAFAVGTVAAFLMFVFYYEVLFGIFGWLAALITHDAVNPPRDQWARLVHPGERLGWLVLLAQLGTAFKTAFPGLVAWISWFFLSMSINERLEAVAAEEAPAAPAAPAASP